MERADFSGVDVWTTGRITVEYCCILCGSSLRTMVGPDDRRYRLYTHHYCYIQYFVLVHMILHTLTAVFVLT